MIVTEVPRPIAAAPERLAQDLFLEARMRRRRIRIAAAALLTLVVVGTVVAFERSTLFPSSNPRGSASEQLVPPPGHIMSLVWTETYPDGGPWGISGVEVATSLIGTRPIDTETLNYVTGYAGRIPKLQVVTLGTDAYLAVPDPYLPSTGKRVCWTAGPQPAGVQAVLGPPVKPYPTTCQTVTKPWIEIPEVSSANASLLELPVLEPPGTSVQIDPLKELAKLRSQVDPSQLFAELYRIAGSLTRTGTATINGVRTTEYKGVVSPGLGAPVPPSEVSSLYYSGLGTDSNYGRLVQRIQTFTVWVDREGVVRRLLVDHFDSVVPDTEVTFTDFNRPIPKLPFRPGQVLLLPMGAWNVTIGGVNYG
jgi:hypothetical protein